VSFSLWLWSTQPEKRPNLKVSAFLRNAFSRGSSIHNGRKPLVHKTGGDGVTFYKLVHDLISLPRSSHNPTLRVRKENQEGYCSTSLAAPPSSTPLAPSWPALSAATSPVPAASLMVFLKKACLPNPSWSFVSYHVGTNQGVLLTSTDS
jgi:hypothetical protein